MSKAKLDIRIEEECGSVGKQNEICMVGLCWFILYSDPNVPKVPSTSDVATIDQACNRQLPTRTPQRVQMVDCADSQRNSLGLLECVPYD